MTTKPVSYLELGRKERHGGEIGRFPDRPYPDAPPEELTAYYAINHPGYPPSLVDHFGNRETTIITSEVAAALIPYADTYDGVRYPDLLIAFNVNPAANTARKGYLIPEQGKPPDFVLEVASESSKERDEGAKRREYAKMGVPEYWRFDDTGGRFHSAALAGDRLVDGEYQPIVIHETEDGGYWGHSEALGLDLCWESGRLRWYDPVGQRYLPTFDDRTAALYVETARADAEADRADAERDARIDADARADAEQDARIAAEARVRELEGRLREQGLEPPDG